MYLHGLGILHGNVTPVGKPKERVSRVLKDHNVQDNVFINWAGEACLGEFGIAGAFRPFGPHAYELGTLRYMAPECFLWGSFGGLEASRPSKESDIYSLAMTSFSVRSCVMNIPPPNVTPYYNQVLTGVVPYDGGGYHEICWNVKGGVRPSRPTGPSRNQWLEDPVWDVITDGWRHDPKLRCDLPAVYHVFLTGSQRGAKIGKSSAQNSGNPTTTEKFGTLKQDASHLEGFSRGSPLSSSCCEIRTRKSRGASMRWIW